MQKVWKVVASILICTAIFASTAAVYEWSNGSDPMGAFIVAFLTAIIFGSWLFILAFVLLFTITSYYKKATIYVYVLAGSIMGMILPLLTGNNFFDLQGFRIDFIAYFLSGAMFGWLYSNWIQKLT